MPSLNPDNELLLDVRLDGSSLGFAILGYRDGNRLWLSLSELMDVLQFPINVDADSGRAGGWYIQEERGFALNLEAGTATVGTRDFDLDGQAQAFQGDIFVTAEALQQWFPVALTPDIRQLQLVVETSETIPLQARLARSRIRPSSGAGAFVREPVLPFQETPHRALGAHATDIRLNLSSVLEDQEDTSTSFSGNYSILSRGDLAWMTSTIAISGSKSDEVTDGRFKLERSDLNAPLSLEHIEVGDVDPGSRGLLVRGGGAREGLSGLFADQQVDLRGNVPPDWEVELYRNGVLIDFQVVDGDAQYEFLDVPLEFGENRFEFVLYGPFGEERREVEVYFAGRSGLELGDVSYELAAVQDGRSVFDVKPPTPKGEVDTGRFLGNFNVGLASNAVASFGVDSFVDNDQRVEDYSAGLSVNFASVQANAGYQDRALIQDEATALVRARLGRTTTTSVRYTEYLDGDLDESRLPADKSLWAGGLGIATRIASVPVNFDSEHLEREESSASAATLGTTFSPSAGVRLSHALFYDREEISGVVDERTGGSINVSTGLRPWRVRAGVGYGISPETEVNTVNASANLRIDSRMTMNFDVNHSARNDYTTYRTGFNWLLDYIQLSPQVIYDSNERWVGLVSLSTSFNPRPDRVWPAVDRLSQTGSGAAYALAFMDHNGNGVRDVGEPGLDDVRIDAVQAWGSARTEADGSAYLTRLRKDRVTDIAIDPTTLADLDLRPATPGVSIKPRPGSWSRVDFPVIRTMELEGHVYTRVRGQGEKRLPVERAKVELINSKGEVLASQRTAFDGFFLFSAVPPGAYEVRLGESLRDRVLDAPGRLAVTAQGGTIRDLDIVLEAPEQRQLFQAETDKGFAPAASAPIALPSEPKPQFRPQAEPEPAPGSVPVIAPVATGRWYVQLGAFGQRGNAERYWERLQDLQALLDTATPKYERSGTLTLLLAGPGRSEDEARSLCDTLKARGQDCIVREIAR